VTVARVDDAEFPALAETAVTERIPGRARGRVVLAGLFLVALVASGCQRVGLSPPPSVAPAPTIEGPVIPELVGAPPGPARAVPLPPLEVESALDPILHSAVASDPRLEERVEFWVNFWTTRGAGSFARYLERMALYEGLVERELADRGLPASLKYLPIVESGYHDLAVSRVGATGLWQIMAPTASGLGLTVSAVVDDRRDAVASTRAALDYLQEMYGMFDSWFLALAAYNAGPGRIRGILSRGAPGREVNDDALYLDLRARFPAETREFVPRFLAAARLAGNPEAHGFGRPVGVAPLAFDEVMVPDATSLDVVAWAAGVDESEIRALNPHYLRGFTPVGQPRAVRVPAGTANRFEIAYAQVPPSERISFMEHAVARGETLGGIAGRYGIRLADLQAANGNLNPRRLQVGQRLVIPIAGGRRELPVRMAEGAGVDQEARVQAPDPGAAGLQGPAGGGGSAGAVDGATGDPGRVRGDDAVGGPTDPTSSAVPVMANLAAEAEPGAGGGEAASSRRHRVAAGDNLWALARRYGMTVADLERWNGLGGGGTLRVGQELYLGPGLRTHTVVRGDTWGGLARRFGTTAGELARVNGRTPSQVIRVGEQLRIP
jgi:membrane-bound lytic murein transglycosylase D